MFTVVITEKSGSQRRLSFGEPEVTIGRVPGNDVVLPKGNVSKRHSRIVLKDNRFIVVDLKSTNGTYVNGRKITSPLVVKEGDKIYIGDFVLTLEGDASVPPGAPRPRAADLEMSEQGVPPLPSRAPDPLMSDESLPAVLRGSSPDNGPPGSMPPPPGTARHPSMPPVIGELMSDKPPLEQTNVVAYESSEAPEPGDSLPPIPPPPLAPGARGTPSVVRPAAPPVPGGTQTELRLLMLRVARDFDVDMADLNSTSDERRWAKADRIIVGKINELGSEGLIKSDRIQLAKTAIHEAVGLGPLDALLADPSVFHVVIERFDRIRADRGRGLTLEPSHSFSSPQAIITVVRRLCAEAGISGPLAPSIDLSLPNGLHLVVMLGTAASEGPVVSVRRRPTQQPTLAAHKTNKVLDEGQIRTIQTALRAKRPIWFVGPASVDLAGFLGAVLGECPAEERVAMFERSPEVALGERSAVCLRLGDVSMTALLDRVRYFRPDRLVAYDPREEELRSLLSVLAQRQDGSLATLESKSAKDALATLERAAGADAVLRAVSVIVELTRTPNGARVTGVFEPGVDASGGLTLGG